MQRFVPIAGTLVGDIRAKRSVTSVFGEWTRDSRKSRRFVPKRCVISRAAFSTDECAFIEGT